MMGAMNKFQGNNLVVNVSSFIIKIRELNFKKCVDKKYNN